jgi:hypothetical protein
MGHADALLCTHNQDSRQRPEATLSLSHRLKCWMAITCFQVCCVCACLVNSMGWWSTGQCNRDTEVRAPERRAPVKALYYCGLGGYFDGKS